MDIEELRAVQAMLEVEARAFQQMGDEADAAGDGCESIAFRAGMAAFRRMSVWIEDGEHWHFAGGPTDPTK